MERSATEGMAGSGIKRLVRVVAGELGKGRVEWSEAGCVWFPEALESV